MCPSSDRVHPCFGRRTITIASLFRYLSWGMAKFCTSTRRTILLLPLPLMAQARALYTVCSEISYSVIHLSLPPAVSLSLFFLFPSICLSLFILVSVCWFFLCLCLAKFKETSGTALDASNRLSEPLCSVETFYWCWQSWWLCESRHGCHHRFCARKIGASPSMCVWLHVLCREV